MKRPYRTRSLALVAMLFATACATGEPKPYEGRPDQVPKVPGLKNAKIKTLWIPDKIEGNRWEAGHYLYIVEDQATWKVE